MQHAIGAAKPATITPHTVAWRIQAYFIRGKEAWHIAICRVVSDDEHGYATLIRHRLRLQPDPLQEDSPRQR